MADRDSRHETWVRGVSQRIDDLFYSSSMPRHVLDELGRLLGYRDVRWIDGDLKVEQLYRFNGRLVLFTDDLVAVADLEGERQTRFESGEIGKTCVSLFRRDSLTEIRVPGYDKDAPRNWPSAWDKSGAEEWPKAREVRLDAVYLDRVVELYLNEGRDGEDAQRLFEALVDDLARN